MILACGGWGGGGTLTGPTSQWVEEGSSGDNTSSMRTHAGPTSRWVKVSSIATFTLDQHHFLRQVELPLGVTLMQPSPYSLLICYMNRSNVMHVLE